MTPSSPVREMTAAPVSLVGGTFGGHVVGTTNLRVPSIWATSALL